MPQKTPRRVLALLCLSAPLLYSQAQSNSGDLTGAVLDPSGNAIRDAHVRALDASRGLSREGTTGTDGNYRLTLLPPGLYTVRAEAPNFSPQIVEGVRIRVGETVTLPLTLQVGPVNTEVKITAETPVVEVERTQQASTIETQQILNLPINRRNYLDLVLLTPGVVETNDLVDGTDFRVVQAPQSGLSFGGGNGRGNSFTIDGVENYINSGGVRQSLSQEAVAEFQINRNSFTAELGGGFGGAVNIISKSGTNEVHGNLFGFLRHRSIQARNYFDPGKSAFTRSQAGATFGAPIKKDRTFLFAALERLDRHETSFVPILQDRSAFGRLTIPQQQLVDFFIASGNPLLRQIAGVAQQQLITNNFPRTLALFNTNSGVFPFSENQTQMSIRLDHRFSNHHSLFSRLNGALNDTTNAQLGALVAYNRGRSVGIADGTGVISDTYVFSPRLVNELRVMFNHNIIDVTTIDKNGPQIDINGYGLFGREIFLPSLTKEWHTQVQEIVSWTSGRHSWKFGIDINPVRNAVRSETFFSGRFSFGEQVPLGLLLNTAAGDPNFSTNTLAPLLVSAGRRDLVANLSSFLTSVQAYNLGLPLFYQQGFGNPNWIGITQRYNLFAQDTWRVTPKLTLNYGLRYELEVNPSIVGTDPNNVAPRVGIAFTPRQDGHTVIRAGAGLFYSQNNLQIANVADTLSGNQISQVFVRLTGLPGVINPATRQPVTSADIYQRLLATGVLGNRPITRDDIGAFGIQPSANFPGAVKFGIVPNWVNPYSEQASLEIEQGIGTLALSAGVNVNRGVHLPRILDRNLAYGPRRADGQPTFVFLNPLLAQNNIFEPTANSFYHAFIFQANKRFSRGLTVLAHYTFSRATDETTDFNTDFQPNDQLNARADRALSSFDQRHRFVASAVGQWKGFTVAPIFVANSGRPFNVLTGADTLGDNHPTTHRPLGAGRNIGHGPAYYTTDLRISRKFAFGEKGRNVELLGEGFNLLNRTNFRTVNNVVGAISVGDLPQPLIGVRGPVTSPLSFTSAYDPRQFQFGLKVNF